MKRPTVYTTKKETRALVEKLVRSATRRDMTFGALAKVVGCTPSALWLWRQGERRMLRSTARRVRNAELVLRSSKH